MKLKSLLLVCFSTVAAWAAEPLPQFNATLSNGRESRFVLVSPDGRSSSWLKLGDSFGGVVLKSYDAPNSTLEVERDGESHKLSLASAARVVNAPAASPASLADAEEVLKMMRFDEMMAKVMEQQKQMIGPMLQQAAAKMSAPPEDRERFLAFQKKMLDETMASLVGPEMRADVAKIYSETFSKEELAALGAFYGTPAGQSMIDKQPEIQQKMMAAMMPRMQQLGPRMQQMTQEFKAEMEAKKAAPSPSTTPAKP